MEPSHNPDMTPEELDALSAKLIDHWTLEEREEFFSSQDAMTGLLGGGVATNWNPSESLPPITLSGLQETYANVEESLFRGIHITSIVPPVQGWPIVAHCDICHKTEIVLSPYAAKPEKGDYWKMEGTCLDDDEHIKHNMYPQKWYPWREEKRKFQPLDPKKRWPNTPIPEK